MAVVLAAADVVHVADFAGAFHATPASAVRCNDVVLVELAAAAAGGGSGSSTAPLPVLGVPVDALRVTWRHEEGGAEASVSTSDADADAVTSAAVSTRYALVFQDAHLLERAALITHTDRSGRAAPDLAPRLFRKHGVMTEMLVRQHPRSAARDTENAANAAAAAANAAVTRAEIEPSSSWPTQT